MDTLTQYTLDIKDSFGVLNETNLQRSFVVYRQPTQKELMVLASPDKGLISASFASLANLTALVKTLNTNVKLSSFVKTFIEGVPLSQVISVGFMADAGFTRSAWLLGPETPSPPNVTEPSTQASGKPLQAEPIPKPARKPYKSSNGRKISPMNTLMPLSTPTELAAMIPVRGESQVEIIIADAAKKSMIELAGRQVVYVPPVMSLQDIRQIAEKMLRIPNSEEREASLTRLSEYVRGHKVVPPRTSFADFLDGTTDSYVDLGAEVSRE